MKLGGLNSENDHFCVFHLQVDSTMLLSASILAWAPLLLLGLFSTARGCALERVVLFAGELRGDAALWRHIHRVLVAPNNLDVVIDIWDEGGGAHAREEELRSIMVPCMWFGEPQPDGNWTRRAQSAAPALRATPEAGPSGSQFLGFLGNVQEAHHMLQAFYRQHHSFTLLEQALEGVALRPRVVVRARLDHFFDTKVLIPEALPPHSVWAPLSWGPISLEAGDTEPACPKMMNDFFAYGDWAGMQDYHSAYGNLTSLLTAMRADPGYRLHWEVGNVRAPGTFLHNPGAFLAWQLRTAGTRCFDLSARLSPWNTRANCVSRLQPGGRWACHEQG